MLQFFKIIKYIDGFLIKKKKRQYSRYTDSQGKTRGNHQGVVIKKLNLPPDVHHKIPCNLGKSE